jgi:hypothetical protein
MQKLLRNLENVKQKIYKPHQINKFVQPVTRKFSNNSNKSRCIHIFFFLVNSFKAHDPWYLFSNQRLENSHNFDSFIEKEFIADQILEREF